MSRLLPSLFAVVVLASSSPGRALTQPSGAAIPSRSWLQRRGADRPRRAVRLPVHDGGRLQHRRGLSRRRHLVRRRQARHLRDHDVARAERQQLHPVAAVGPRSRRRRADDARDVPPDLRAHLHRRQPRRRALQQRLRLVQRHRRATGGDAICTSCSTVRRRPAPRALLDVRSDPAYQGGDIGFFLVTPEDHASAGSCAGGDCCATVARLGGGVGYAYYSQRAFNPDGGGATPYIHLLTYLSKLATRKFYFAWEDTFRTTNADFTESGDERRRRRVRRRRRPLRHRRRGRVQRRRHHLRRRHAALHAARRRRARALRRSRQRLQRRGRRRRGLRQPARGVRQRRVRAALHARSGVRLHRRHAVRHRCGRVHRPALRGRHLPGRSDLSRRRVRQRLRRDRLPARHHLPQRRVRRSVRRRGLSAAGRCAPAGCACPGATRAAA